MIVRKYKIFYLCSNPSCRLPMSMSTINFNKSVDVTGLWRAIDRKRICYSCNWPMEIREITCRVSTDIFGTDLEGVWSCDNHPYGSYYPIPLRKSYYGDVVGSHLYPLYKEIIKSKFPWKCPTCKEPMKYAEKRDSSGVG